MTAVTSPSVLANPLAAALPAPQAAVRTAGFAQVLDAHRAESAPAPSPAPEAKTEEAHAQANRTAEETRQRQLRAQRQSAARPAAEAPAPQRAETPVADEKPEVTDRAAAKKMAEDDVPVDPALADLLASLNLQAAPAASGEAVTPEADAAAGPGVRAETARPDLAATADTATRGAVRRQAADLGDSAGAGQDSGSEGGRRQNRLEPEALKARGHDAGAQPLAAQPDAASAMWQAALEQAAMPAAESRSRTTEPARVDGAAAASALTSAAPERPAAEASAPTVVHLPTPADAPDFPQALGAQLSVFAQEGIQQAELHLNPADMGSISIQIALDGNQAKVDFGADSAATRQLIENGLPELAAALRDAGFTLAGGGVHSQARQAGGDGDSGRDGRGEGRSTARVGGAGGDGDASATRAPVTQRTVRAGGVDLYA